MTGKNAVYGLVGMVIGAVATYFVMDYMHEKELDDIYNEVADERKSRADEAMDTYDPGQQFGEKYEGDGEEDLGSAAPTAEISYHEEAELMEHFPISSDPKGVEVHKPENESLGQKPVVVVLDRDEEEEEQHVIDGHSLDGEELPFTKEDIEEDEEGPGPEDPIFVIEVGQLGENKITMDYDHLDKKCVVNKTMSGELPEGFDEIIENSALEPLIGDDAYLELMHSLPRAIGADVRLICVRNTIIDLDMMIAY